MMFGLNPEEEQAANEFAAQNPYDPARDTAPGWFAGAGHAIANIPEASASGLILAGNVIGGKVNSYLGGDDDWGKETRADLVDIQKQIRPDPATTGLIGQTLFGVGKVIPQAIVGGLAGGPWGAAGVVGTAQGIEETERLKSEGIDPATAGKAGLVSGIVQGGGIFLPASLSGSLLTRLSTGAAMNVAMGGASRGATGGILREHGYNDMAEQYKILDGSGLLTDAILGGVFGAAGHGKHDAPLNDHDPVNANTPGDLDLGLAANSIHQYEIDSAPGIPTDIETRNAHAQAMDIVSSQLLAGRSADVGANLENTTFLTRPRDPSIAADFREAAKDNGISSILMENNKRDEAVVTSVIDQSMRHAGRSEIEAESVAPLFARTLARFSEPFGTPVLDAFNKSLLEFQKIDENGRVVALGNNVTSLLSDVDAIGRGERLDPSVHEAAADFGMRLDQLGISPQDARLMPADQLLDQVYNVGKPAVEGAEHLPTLELGQNENGQMTLGLRDSPQEVNPEHQAAITNRLMQAPPVEPSPLGFVSKMERVLGEKLNKNGTPEQFKQQIEAFQKAGQFKPDERNWSSLDSWLDEQPKDAKISRDDIIQHLQENRFHLVEHGADEIGNMENQIEEIRLRDFRETARDNYQDDILQELKDENDGLPEDEQRSENELEKEAEQKAYDLALESYNEDPYNQVRMYDHSIDLPDGTSVDMEIRERGDGDYVEYRVGDRDWKDARSVDQALQEIHLALAEDHGVGFDGEGGDVPFEEYTGDGGSNYRFFRLATDKLRGGDFKQTGHYPEKNVLAHMRTKDRVGPNGEKMMFIEEIQSDLHQAAYKSKLKTGIAYKTDISPEIRAQTEKELMDADAKLGLAKERSQEAEKRLRSEVATKMEGATSNQKSQMADAVNAILFRDRHNTENGFAPIIAVDNLVDKAFDEAHAANPLDMSVYGLIKRAGNYIDTNYGGTGYLHSFRDMVNDWFDGNEKSTREYFEGEPDLEPKIKAAQDARAWMLAQPEPKTFSSADLHRIANEVIAEGGESLKHTSDDYNNAMREQQALRAKNRAGDDAPPGAPFSKTWREVAFKRLLTRAADEGYESVGWTIGTQQNVRYNLSRFIENLHAAKAEDGRYSIVAENRAAEAIAQAAGVELEQAHSDTRGRSLVKLTDEQLDTALGKEGADSVRKQAGDGKVERVDFAQDIEVGGDRKGNLYDGMLPQEAGKILKKLDPTIKVEEVPYSIKENGRDMKKIWYAPLTEKARGEITQGFELFQRERGAITFNRAEARDFETRLKKVVIEFGNAADESTAAHEFSHWATATHRMYAELARKRIEAGETNPEIHRIADDWETLKKEVGAKDDVFSVEQEEKIASWFEGYMRTGQAPSERLQPIFDRFKNWFTKIYQDITGKGMEVSPPVKEVFDRWLADADEIRSKQAKESAAARDVNDNGDANMGQPQEEQQNLPPDPVQQIIAEKPDLTITDEDGKVLPAAEAIENAQAEVEQAQKDSHLFDVAVSCFLRNNEV